VVSNPQVRKVSADNRIKRSIPEMDASEGNATASKMNGYTAIKGMNRLLRESSQIPSLYNERRKGCWTLSTMP